MTENGMAIDSPPVEPGFKNYLSAEFQLSDSLQNPLRIAQFLKAIWSSDKILMCRKCLLA